MGQKKLNQTQTLSNKQNQAVEKLNRLKVGALFMAPGTGKTRVAIELVENTDCDFSLWIVPFQTKDNLQKELTKWNFSKSYKIIGVETLSSSDRAFLETMHDLEQHKSNFIIVDESLKIKNDTAIRTNRVLRLSELSEYRLILNGTPLSKNLLDMWSQMDFLSPKILKMSHQQFKDTFCNYIRYRQYRPDGSASRWFEFIKGYENLPYLYSLIEPYVFDAELQLNKKKQYTNIKYSVNECYAEYNLIKTDFMNSLSRDDPDSFIRASQAMQHSYCVEPQKIKIVQKLLDDKTLIFTKFIKSKEVLLAKFPNARVLSYGKDSFGLNLQEYNKIIFFDKTFDYAQRDQAEHRIFRLGQSENVTYYDLTGDVNLEKTIDRNIEYKSSLLAEIKKLLNKGSDINWEKLI